MDQKQNNNNFGVLRILAAVLVAISHSYAITGNATNEPLSLFSNEYLEFSSIGLFIFFFISGYLVKKSADESKNAFHFIKKRILRIYPALIFVVLISVFIAGPLISSLATRKYFSHPDTALYLWTLSGLKIRFFLPGVYETPAFAIKGFNGSLWSIKLEVELYLSLFALIICGFIKTKKIFILWSLVVICGFFTMYFFKWYNIFFPDHKHLFLATTFYTGALMQTIKFKNGYLGALLIMSGFVLMLNITGILRTGIMIDQVIFFSLCTYFIAFAFVRTITLKNDISYGLYIYTFPLQQLFFQLSGFNHSPLLNLALSLSCSSIIALISWKLIEKPALKLKPHFS